MKILYLVHQFYPSHYTGTEKVLFNVASMMQKWGHKVKVITFSFYEDSFYDERKGDFLLKEYFYQGIPVLAFRHKNIPADVHINFQDEILAGIAKDIIEKEKPDIVHAGHLMRVGELILATKMLNIPYILTLTDFWLICPKFVLVNSQGNLCRGPELGCICQKTCPEIKEEFTAPRLKIAKDILFNAQAVISPSRFLASIFKNELPALDVKIINHGLSYNKLRKNGKHYKKGDKIIFCYAGSLNPHKGVHIIIEAFKKIKNSNIGLKIYGSGDVAYSQRLKDMAQDNRIEFCGVYTENEVADVFNNIDILVVPSLWYETYSLILHEALVSNIPVLASNVGVMAEKIKDNVNGFTFRIGDSDHLKELIEKIINNPEILNSLKNNIENIFIPTIEQEVFAYDRLYKGVLLKSIDSWERTHKTYLNRGARKRILIAIHQFFPEFSGGAEILTFDSAKALQTRGHDVRIFTACPVEKHVEDKDRFDSYMYEGLHVERFKHSVVAMGGQTNTFELEYNNLFFASYFREFLKKWKPDIVHFFHLHRLSASAIDVCVELGIPTVYTATDFWMVCLLSQLRQYDNSTCTGPRRNAVNCLRHLVLAYQPPEIRSKVEKLPNWLLALAVLGIRSGMFSKYWFSPYVKTLSERPAFMRKRLNCLDMILVPTRVMGKILEQSGLNRSRVQLQQYGINLQHFKGIINNRGKAEKLRIGFIGAIFEHKGIHLLIEAVRSLPDSIPLELKIYGNLDQCPEYSKNLKSIAAQDGRIKFCGFFHNDQVGEIFPDLDVLVVPSIWYENSPVVIYEAQAARCPVIATNLEGMSEVIEHEVNGLLFEKGDVKGLAEAIRRLAENRNLLVKLANNARRPKSIIENVLELESYYQEILSKKEIKG